MHQILRSNQFEKSLKKILRRADFNYTELIDIINRLSAEQLLEYKNKDHLLSGKYTGSRECHISFDILLIYKIYKKEKLLLLENIGSHDDLFGK